jgi:hypothetical protein
MGQNGEKKMVLVQHLEFPLGSRRPSVHCVPVFAESTTNSHKMIVFVFMVEERRCRLAVASSVPFTTTKHTQVVLNP